MNNKMKHILLALVFAAFSFISCNEDKELHYDYKFEVKTAYPTEVITTSINTPIRMSFSFTGDLYDAYQNISYKVNTDDSRCEVKDVSDDNNKKTIKVNETFYQVNQRDLYLTYTGTAVSKQLVTIVFQNKQGYQVEKKFTFIFE